MSAAKLACVCTLGFCFFACTREEKPRAPAAAATVEAPADLTDLAEKISRAAHAGFASSDAAIPASLRVIHAMEQDLGASLGFERASRELHSGDGFLIGIPPPGTTNLTMGTIDRRKVFFPIDRLLTKDRVGDETGPEAVQNGFLLVSILTFCRPAETDVNGEVVEKLLRVKWIPQAKPGVLSLLNEMNAKDCLSPESFAGSEALARALAASLPQIKGEPLLVALQAMARYYMDLIPADQFTRVVAAQRPDGAFAFDGVEASGTAALLGAHVMALVLRAKAPDAAKNALERAYASVHQAKLVQAPKQASVEPGLPR